MSVDKEHRYPHSNVFYRRLRQSYPLIVRGEGCRLFDEDGKSYLDACSGAYVAGMGHGVAVVADAVAAQARKLGYVNGTAFTHHPVEELATEISKRCAEGLDKVFFLCSGTDVVEASLKLARQYWAETGRPEKQKIIALTPSYHGSTILALSASGRRQYKSYFSGWLIDFPKIPAPYPYRQEPGHPALTGEALEKRILREGAENVAAFIAEPIGGSSTGATVPPADYWKRVRELCDKHEILFIADEVLTGVGRTGAWSALEAYGVAPDIHLFAKGLAGGYGALAALVTSTRVLDPIAAGTGALLHNQTFSHHPIMCAAALAALRYYDEHKLFERAAKMGKLMHEKLKVLLDHPNVGDVRGRGLLAGIEFVSDKKSKKPFPRSLQMAETFQAAAREIGLVVWVNSGQVDGTDGDLAMIAPPYIVSEEELDEIVRLFRTALDAALNSLEVKS